jgi:hypothetical protein
MMDGGVRMPRPVGRGAATPEPVQHRQPEAPQPVQEAPRAMSQPVTQHHAPRAKKSSKKRFTLPLIIAAILLLGVLGWFAWSKLHTAGPAIDSNKYQAVFFTNGQVYFGKLQTAGTDYMKLTNIYYLQTQTSSSSDSSNPQKTTSDQGNVQLIKLGDEVHGPEDQMIISKDQILFYENLKADGKVAKSIEQYVKNH